MPVYEYRASEKANGCPFCRNGFSEFQGLSQPPVRTCPKCEAPVQKVISRFAVGFSRTTLDNRAKNAGFHKLKKRGRGEYEKEY